jgi:cell wall assembly regulator SMI1
MSGATEAQIDAAERALGLRFPSSLRTQLRASNGSEQWHGDVFLMLYDTDSIVAVNREIERHPGFLAFASDGSRELIGFDLRGEPPPIVMIDTTSEGWPSAHVQADTFDEFMAQRERGEALRWEDG